MKCIIDRIEGAFAVAELPDCSHADLPLCVLPGIEEGDIIEIRILKAETEERRKQMEDKKNRLFRKKRPKE